MLRPAGGGLYVVSTGRAEQLAVQRQLYGVADEAAIQAAFVSARDRTVDGKRRDPRRAVQMSAPALRRGASFGPQGIRAALLAREADLRGWMDRHGVIDVGDVFVIPQLLDDDMLAPAQIAASRAAIYGGAIARQAATSAGLAPLDRGARARVRVRDQSARRPDRARRRSLGRVAGVGGARQDASPRSLGHRAAGRAHTDLLAERLGIKYCFATWSYHANELLGRDGRLVQVGVRASRHDRAHWEHGLGVRQFWAEEIRRAPEASLDAVLAHLRALGVQSVYFS